MQILLHKRIYYSFVFILVNLLFAGAAIGQTITWTGSTGTKKWEDTGNWNTNAVPSVSSDVNIPAGSNIIVASSTNVNSIKFQNSSSTTATLTVNAGITLNVSTSVVLQNNATANTSAIISGSGILKCATFSVGNTLAPNNQTQTSLTSSISLLNITGDLNLYSQYTNGSRYNDALFTLNSGVVKIGGTVNLIKTGPSKGDAIFTLATSTQTRSLILSGLPAFSGDGSLVVNGTNASVSYDGQGNQVIKSASYNNLTLSGTGEKTMSSVNINGNLIIESSLSASSGSIINVTGNWVNNGTFTAGSSTINFNGSSAQNISGSVKTTFNNLTLNNTSGVSLDQSVDVGGLLTLTNGSVTVKPSATLTLNNGASAVAGAPFSSSKCVITQVDRITNGKGVLMVNNIPTTGYDFPVGTGSNYLPATIRPTAANNFGVTVFEGATLNGEPNGIALSDAQKLEVVNAVWDIHGNVAATLTLKFPDAANLIGNSFPLTEDNQQGISHYINSLWDESDGISDGDLYSVTRYLTSFSPQNPRKKSLVNNTLPVHFSNVRASEKSSGVQVEFTNTTESDLAYYEVERSLDGNAFSMVKKISPSKNDYGSATYSYLDATAKDGRFTYRIKAVETTGKIIYSSLVSISLGAKSSNSMSVYAKGGQVALQISNLPAGKYQIQLFNAAGQLLGVENISHGGGSLSQTTSLNSAKAGIYILNINGTVRMQQKFLVQ